MFIKCWLFAVVFSFSSLGLSQELENKSPPSLSLVRVDRDTLFYLSLSDTFSYFKTDDKGNEALSKINPVRVKEEITRLITMSNSLFEQMQPMLQGNSELLAQFQNTQQKNLNEALDKIYTSVRSSLPFSNDSFALTPISVDHLHRFRENHKASAKVFNNPTLDHRIGSALTHVMSSGFLPHERKIDMGTNSTGYLLYIFNLTDHFDIYDNRIYRGEDRREHFGEQHFYPHFEAHLRHFLYTGDFYQRHQSLMTRYHDLKRKSSLPSANLSKQDFETLGQDFRVFLQELANLHHNQASNEFDKRWMDSKGDDPWLGLAYWTRTQAYDFFKAKPKSPHHLTLILQEVKFLQKLFPYPNTLIREDDYLVRILEVYQ